MSTSMPFTDPADQAPAQSPDWPMTLLVVAVCLTVIASGWGVSRLVLNGGSQGASTLVENPSPQARPPGERTEEADPADAEAVLEVAAEELRSSPSVQVSYAQYSEGTEVGRGWARTGEGLDVEFEHYHRTDEGVEVFRYELDDAGHLMTAEKGLDGLTLLDPPTEADLRLCSVDFLLATMDALVASAVGVELVGTEEVRLPTGPEGIPASTHTAHRYSGSFPASMGGYDTDTGHNTLTPLPEAEFDLWVDEDGRPRRLSYETADGDGETYDYHAVTE